jgi:hypothetical protein
MGIMINSTSDGELFLRFTTSFSGIRVIDSKLMPTKWTLKTDLILQDELDDFDFNFILMKVKFWFEQLINNSVFFAMENEWAIESFLASDLENNTVLIPGDPTDDLLTMVFHSKLNALGEGKVIFGGLDLQSDTSSGLGFIFLGNGTSCLPTMTEWIGERTFFTNPWWNRDDASAIDIFPMDDEDLTIIPDFAFSLDFLRDAIRPPDGVQPPQVLKAKVIKPEFRPTIIRNESK